jgi:hypothetical protein
MKLYLRGFAIVFFTALNVTCISRGHYLAAFLSGWAISAIWWANAGQASLDRTWQAGALYATGAACGTLAGMWIGGRL